MNVLKNKLQIFVTLVFLGFGIWWVYLQHVVNQQGTEVSWFENTYGLMALVGAVIGFFAIQKWGGVRTVLGKALVFFSLGLFAQEAGQLIYSYYTQVDKIQIPYPSWGDAAYFGSVLFYMTAALFLGKAVGVKFSIRKSFIYKTVAVLVPIIMVVASYAILLHNHQYDTSKPLTVFLDGGYPIVQASYVSVALVTYLLSRKLLGGIMKSGVLLVLLALLVQYIADFTFIYQSDRGTYVPGRADDFLYLLAYFVMGTAMIRFHVIYKKLQQKTHAHVSSAQSVPLQKGEA